MVRSTFAVSSFIPLPSGVAAVAGRLSSPAPAPA
jgi:hypothetical protein